MKYSHEFFTNQNYCHEKCSHTTKEKTMNNVMKNVSYKINSNAILIYVLSAFHGKNPSFSVEL